MSEALVVRSHLREYEVRFVDDFTVALAEHAARGFFLVDATVFELYRDRIAPLVPAERMIVIEATERHKTIEHCTTLLYQLVERRVRRGDLLVAIGGGVVQDITAFMASVLYRGLEWVFYPTTLLAQADSCIGSKSSINMGEYKNLLGNFYPPAQIVSDASFLRTLPQAEVRSGVGEMLHFFFYAGSEHPERIRDEYELLVAEPGRLVPFIRASLEIKRAVAERDEFDRGERRLFNYGHTFGHAIESVTDYGVNHGQAVTLGMDLANHVSRGLGFIGDQEFEAMHRLLEKNLPDFQLGEDQLDAYLRALSKDKKNQGAMLGCILSHGYGKLQLHQLPMDETLTDLIAGYFGLRPVAV
ncbi:MAG TPA: AroB-related putative sugar phosphate phospholyase (cyclizing) [Longimicrobium sp.]|nr:AroB-related putative sugar phosphate phospholyase (cyclizing) [Longimicrobium sp.]